MRRFFAIVLTFIMSCSFELLAIESKKKSGDYKTVIFERVTERNEKAFSILVPKGWITEGGIIRINPLEQGGPAQSIAAKVDFSVKRKTEDVVLHWLPEILFCDASKTIAGQMGLFPVGSNYNGMPVYPLMSAGDFLMQFIFAQLHPQATDVQITEQRKSTKLIDRYQKQLAQLQSMVQIPLDFSYDAATLTITYQEDGKQFKERLITVIEDMGQIGAGMWSNKETFLFRTPLGEFDDIEPTISVIQGSIKVSPEWLSGEIKGQIERGEIALKTQRYIQDVDRQILENRQKTNAEIRNEMFLTLTGQEEYVNPYTKEVELGSNEWKRRWINGNGDIVYTNDLNYNPNQDDLLKRTDFKISEVRPR